MKKVAITFMLLAFNFGFSQVDTLFFEQIAFDFYKDTILEKYPFEKKIRIPKYAADLHPTYYRFQISKCLTGEFLDEKTNLEVLSSYEKKKTDFDFYNQLMDYEGIDKKQFRIKNSKTESYPYLRISIPYHKKDEPDKLFVIVSENYKRKNITYYLLIGQNGIVKNWCRSVSELITIH